MAPAADDREGRLADRSKESHTYPSPSQVATINLFGEPLRTAKDAD